MLAKTFEKPKHYQLKTIDVAGNDGELLPVWSLVAANLC